MRRGRTFMRREPIGVTMRRTQATMRALISDPVQLARYEADNPESRLPALPVKRGPRIDHPDLEHHVITAVGDLLKSHPKILIAVRQNSGGMQYEDSKGDAHSMWFYRVIRAPENVRIVDYWGFLKDRRPYAFECKRPSWKAPSGKRELEQSAYIDLVKSCGGIGMFITDAEQVRAALA